LNEHALDARVGFVAASGFDDVARCALESSDVTHVERDGAGFGLVRNIG
jgi:hypothetical protein